MQDDLLNLLDAYCAFLEDYDARSVDIFRSQYQDWKKVCNFVKLTWSTLQNNPSRRLTNYLNRVWKLWWRFAVALRFKPQSGGWCNYTGCTDLAIQGASSMKVCSGCFVAVYCSQRCQKSYVP
jgi:hypothetical protein